MNEIELYNQGQYQCDENLFILFIYLQRYLSHIDRERGWASTQKYYVNGYKLDMSNLHFQLLIWSFNELDW